MKSILLAIVLLSVISFGITADLTKDSLRKLFDDALQVCAEKLHVKLDTSILDVEEKREGLNPNYVPVMTCTYKNIGIFNSNWELDKEVILSQLKVYYEDADRAEEVTDICSKNKETREATTTEFFICLGKHAKP